MKAWQIPLVKGMDCPLTRSLSHPYGYWRTVCWQCPSGSLIGSLIAVWERRQ